MRRGFLLFFLLAMTFRAAGSQPTPLDGVAATVNGKAITVGEVLEAFEPQRRQLTAKLSGEALTQALREGYRNAREGMVDRQLILLAYEAQKMRIPDAVVDRRINEIVNDRFENDRGALMNALAEDRLTYDAWREFIQEQIVLDAMRAEHVEKYVKLSPAAARKVYDENPDRFSTPGKVHLRMIVIGKGGDSPEEKERKRKAAADAFRAIQEGGGFAAIAREVSEDGKAGEGGDWGWVETRMLQPAIAKAADALAPGGAAALIETETDYYILRSEERQPPSAIPFEEVRDEITREIRVAESKRLYRLWIDRLKDAAYVNVRDVMPF